MRRRPEGGRTAALPLLVASGQAEIEPSLPLPELSGEGDAATPGDPAWRWAGCSEFAKLAGGRTPEARKQVQCRALKRYISEKRKSEEKNNTWAPG